MGRSAQPGQVFTSSADPAGTYASFAVTSVGVCAVVVAKGEIDLCTQPGLQDALAAAAEQWDRIIIDMRLVSFLDSTGMAVMVEALKQSRHPRQGALCLVGVSGMVLRALEVAGLGALFEVYSSVEEATGAWATRGRSAPAGGRRARG